MADDLGIKQFRDSDRSGWKRDRDDDDDGDCTVL